MKRMLRKLHQVLGLSVGLWAVVAGLSGSVLVFSDTIDRGLNPQLLRVAPQALPPDVDAAVAKVQARFPDTPLQALRLPDAADAALVFRVGEDDAVFNVFVDPYTAEILGTRDQYGGAMGLLWDLHVHLLAGEPGETVAGVLALFLLGMVISGVVLWWPGRGRMASGFKLRWRAPLLPRLYNLHRVAGALTWPLLLVPAVTGIMLVFHGPITAALLATLGGPPLDLPKVLPKMLPGAETVAESSRAPLSQLLARADAALPGAHLVSVKFPQRADEPLLVRQRFAANSHPNGRSFVALHPGSGAVLKVHDWRAAGLGVRASDYKYPLHIGTAFGLPGRLLVLAIGLLPALLLGTGGYVWWRRRRAPATRFQAQYQSQS